MSRLARAGLPPGARDDFDLVWHSPAPFEARVTKIATTLEALAQVLHESPADRADTRAFASAWSELSACRPETFTRVVSSALAYAVTRRIEAARAGQDGLAVEGDFADALLDIGLLALSGAVQEDRDLELSRPLACSLPCHLPGSALVLMGEGPARVHGFIDGAIRVDTGGEIVHCAVEPARASKEPGPFPPPALPAVVRAPTVRAGQREILLSPWFFAGSSLDASNRQITLSYGLENHLASVAAIQQALDGIQRYAPDTHAQMALALEAVGLEDVFESDGSQASLSDLPGSFIVPVYPGVHANMEMWVHEFYHNRLFALEEMGAVFNDPVIESGGGPLLYSPWRVEPRPLKGLLHSAYVFVPVAGFSLARYRDPALSGPERAYALDETIRHTLQLRMATHLMETRRADFSDWGQLILDQLASAVDDLVAQCEAAGLPEDAPAWVATRRGTGPLEPLTWPDGGGAVSVRDNVRNNTRRGDVNGDCAGLPFAV